MAEPGTAFYSGSHQFDLSGFGMWADLVGVEVAFSPLEELLRERRVDFEKWMKSRSAEELTACMYEGTGLGSMRTAVANWKWLAHKLAGLVDAHKDLLSGLEGLWSALSAKMMMATTISFVGWLHITSWRAKEFSHRLEKVAEAFGQARARAVAPELIKVNRCRFNELMVNQVGRNSAELLAVRDDYGQMWRQNADAMRDYFAHVKIWSSHRSVADVLTPKFTAPPKVTTENAVRRLAQAEKRLRQLHAREEHSIPGFDSQGHQLEDVDWVEVEGDDDGELRAWP